MKCLIISPCGLPVPAVKGGAVLTLIESLIIQNEEKRKLDLTVISSFDQEAANKSEEYKNTNFIFIKEPKICKIIDSIYEKIYNIFHKNPHKTLKRYLWKSYVLSKIKKILLKEEYDKVIFQNSGYLLNVLNSKKISSKYNEKIYYHIHNDIPDNIKVNQLRKCKLLLISKYLEKKIVKFCGKDIKKNIIILKNGFNCQAFNKKLTKEEKEELKKKLNISSSKKIIIFTGRIVEEKGIRELTTAFENMNNEEYILLVVGSHNFGEHQTSPFEQEMHRKFNKLKDKIRFTGFVPYSEIWKYYQLADVAVLPSIWEEPAGLTMLEATAAGVPLISTISGGIPEYLNENQVILLDKEKDLIENIKISIEKIFAEEEKYKDIAHKSSKFVIENYNEEKFYDNFVNSIKD